MRISHFIAVLVLMGLTLAFPGLSRADTKMQVEVGWGWRPRADRWTPVFVTASCDDKTRNVLLNVEWPEGGKYLMHIAQAMTIDSHPRTFPLLVPVHGWDYQQAVFTLSDRDSGKTLAHFPKEGDEAVTYFGGYPDASATFVGVSGATTTLNSLQSLGTSVNIGFLPSRRLPTAPLGFDSLDVLVLNAPNLGSGVGSAPIDDDQQQAIVDWVRAGGKLILWPGDGGFPTSGPLAAVLPAKLGLRQDLTLSPRDLSAIGLSQRYKSLPAYQVEPTAGAQRIAMLNAGQASAYRSRLGLGTVVLSPANVAEMQIDTTEHSKDLWRPLIKGLIAIPGEPVDVAADTDANAVQQKNAVVQNTYDGSSVDDAREKSASLQLANFLGNVPGAGQIGFSYIAIVLLGLMLVVGPVDWFVLKKLGRQPWTWVTTGGWIALVTVGAIFAGYLFKSGDLQYRTVRTIDQAGDAAVASTDYVALYSSRTRTYDVKTEPDGWWQPSGLSEYGSSGMKLDMDFHQTSEGNSPEAMIVNVWSLRFLRGDHIGMGPAVLSADLRLVAGAQPDSWNKPVRVVGTIKNLSAYPLKNVRIVTRRGNTKILSGSSATTSPATIAPASTGLFPSQSAVSVDAVVSADAKTTITAEDPAYRYRYEQATRTPEESELWKVAADLNVRRGKEMAAKVDTGKFAIIYAEAEGPPPAAELVGQQAIEQHRQFIRALVELHDQEGK
jgi:hypothetical protein